MGKLEYEQIMGRSSASENPTFAPSLSIRPHHFFLKNVQDALLGVKDPHRLAIKDSNHRGERAYVEDMIGRSDLGKLNYQKKVEDYFRQLRDLPDSSFVHVDIEPDGICKAACIGRHCVSTNYESNFPPRSILLAEIDELRLIKKRLEKAGYKAGTDFVEKQTMHVLYDLDGEKLNTSKIGTRNQVVFDSLIVSAKALRDITTQRTRRF